MTSQQDTLVRAIDHALALANGKRRMRTLDRADVELCLREALLDAYAFRAGATVANSYGYPAIRTACYAARRSDGALALAIGDTYANKGGCPRPRNIAHVVPQVRPDTPKVRAIALQWADSVTGAEPGVFLVPRRVALALARAIAGLRAHPTHLVRPGFARTACGLPWGVLTERGSDKTTTTCRRCLASKRQIGDVP